MFFALWQKEGSGARSAPPGFVDEGGVWLSDLRSLLSPRSSNERLASPGNGDKLHRRCVGVWKFSVWSVTRVSALVSEVLGVMFHFRVSEALRMSLPQYLKRYMRLCFSSWNVTRVLIYCRKSYTRGSACESECMTRYVSSCMNIQSNTVALTWQSFLCNNHSFVTMAISPWWDVSLNIIYCVFWCHSISNNFLNHCCQ